MASQSRPFVHLRKSLTDPPPAPTWPAEIKVTSLTGPHDAMAAHSLLTTAYDLGGGTIDAFAPWWSALTSDSEYDPTLFFLARDGSGEIVGVAHCWTSAFLKDIAVAGPWRRKGIGTALLLHLFHVFKARGAAHLNLKVESDNPSGAERLYHQLGMRPVIAA
jgi:ribosomal protein S18 acetylase RimI-like enzyme